MSSNSTKKDATLRERFIHEMKQYFLVTIFLFFFFGSFTTYRRLVLAEYHIGYFEYGWALLKALVLAKVILLGEILHLGEGSRDRPLLVTTLWKTLIYGLLIAAFAVVEHLVGAVIHHRPVGDEFQLTGRHGYELLARIQLEVVGLIPLFAFRELARVLGEGKLQELFFRGPGASARVERG